MTIRVCILGIDRAGKCLYDLHGDPLQLFMLRLDDLSLFLHLMGQICLQADQLDRVPDAQ